MELLVKTKEIKCVFVFIFRTVALAIIAIQRMKYIGRIWHTGKRIVSKSVFTITQQK